MASNKEIVDFIKWASPRLAYIASSDDLLEKIAAAGARTGAQMLFDAFNLVKNRATKAGYKDVAEYFKNKPTDVKALRDWGRAKKLFDKRMSHFGKQYKFQAKDLNGQMEELQRVFNLNKPGSINPDLENAFGTGWGSAIGKFVAKHPIIAGTTMVGGPALTTYNLGHSSGYDSGATDGMNQGMYNGMRQGLNAANAYGANALGNTGFMDRLAYLFSGNPSSLNYPQTQDLASMLNRYMAANNSSMF